ncbi:MAG: hypothetical protein NTV30_03665 [Chloroflexi bacterium]|nr:hypothetical protein [Chloroflexota bacterium]
MKNKELISNKEKTPVQEIALQEKQENKSEIADSENQTREIITSSLNRAGEVLNNQIESLLQSAKIAAGKIQNDAEERAQKLIANSCDSVEAQLLQEIKEVHERLFDSFNDHREKNHQIMKKFEECMEKIKSSIVLQEITTIKHNEAQTQNGNGNNGHKPVDISGIVALPVNWAEKVNGKEQIYNPPVVKEIKDQQEKSIEEPVGVSEITVDTSTCQSGTLTDAGETELLLISPVNLPLLARIHSVLEQQNDLKILLVTGSRDGSTTIKIMIEKKIALQKIIQEIGGVEIITPEANEKSGAGKFKENKATNRLVIKTSR